MRTLIIYDDAGVIFSQSSGAFLTPAGLQHIIVDIPQGKYIQSINVASVPHTPILKDIPKTETEILQQQVNDLNLAMASIMGV